MKKKLFNSILSLLFFFPLAVSAFQIDKAEYQIESVAIVHSTGTTALSDETDLIFLRPGDDFISIRLKGVKNRGFIVRFSGFLAQIPIKEGQFQIPEILAAGKYISLEESDIWEGYNYQIKISGTDLYLRE